MLKTKKSYNFFLVNTIILTVIFSCVYISGYAQTATPADAQLYNEEIYTVTVKNSGNGTGKATPSPAAEVGQRVVLTYEVQEGYTLKEWQVITGNINIENTNGITSFIMPSSDVTLTAAFAAENTPDTADYTFPLVMLILTSTLTALMVMLLVIKHANKNE